MDKRTALQENTVLYFEDRPEPFTIHSELGRGGSCIVYNASYVNRAGDRTHVRVKECYPFKLTIRRQESGRLTVDRAGEQAFRDALRQFENGFRALNTLHHRSNNAAVPIDIYSANQTKYIVTAYSNGNALTGDEGYSLRQYISIVKSSARVLCDLHRAGYLYLDLKPSNLFIFPETAELPQFFDFDGILPIRDLAEGRDTRISYTKGFAAPEVVSRHAARIGVHSDVYGVGALLFYLIFHRCPTSADREEDAEYDFTASCFPPGSYRDRLYRSLTDFFHRTLAAFIPSRYGDMAEAESHLEELERLSDTAQPYFISSRVSVPTRFFGRDRELSELAQWLRDEERSGMVLSGMGGIGKSSLARRFISANRGTLDAVIWLDQRGSVRSAFTDDMGFSVNTMERDPNETEEEYFRRKLKLCRRLSHEERVLVVLDNFDGRMDESLQALLSLPWKVLLATREEVMFKGCDLTRLNAIPNREGLYALFESSAGIHLRGDDYALLDRVIDLVWGHTLVVELLGLQMVAGQLDIHEMAELCSQRGPLDAAPEKVLYEGRPEKIQRIVSAMLERDPLTAEERAILKVLSVFDSPGEDVKLTRDLLDLKSLDVFNDLKRHGWLSFLNGRVNEHPIIREVVRRWDWNDTSRQSVLTVFRQLGIQLHGMSKLFPTDKVARYGELRFLVALAFSLYRNIQGDRDLKKSPETRELLYHIICNAPREEESLIEDAGLELLTDPRHLTGCQLIEAMDWVHDVYLHRGNLDGAKIILNMGKRYLNKNKVKDKEAQGRYWYAVGQWYDALIGGRFEFWDKQQKKLMKEFRRVEGVAESFLSDVNTRKAKELLALSYCGRAIGLARTYGGYEKFRKERAGITKNLEKARELILQWNLLGELCETAYYMAWAWYYVEDTFDPARAQAYIDLSLECERRREPNILSLIDNVLSPASNIFMDGGMFEESIRLLNEGIALCEEHGEIEAYQRKRLELLDYIEEVTALKEECEREHDSDDMNGSETPLPQ